VGIFAARFEHPRLVVPVRQVLATERPTPTLTADIARSGTSSFVEVRQRLQGWTGWVRYERFAPNTAVGNDARRRAIVAVAYCCTSSSDPRPFDV
jgi:hypothetical protein